MTHEGSRASDAAVGIGALAQGLVAKGASRLIADRRLQTAVIDVLGRAQRGRELLDDLQSATLHVAGFPSRRDVHRLSRRSASVRRNLAELERAITRLEREISNRSPGAPRPGDIERS